MNRDRFEQLVATAIEALPDEFLSRLENIVVVVDNHPTDTQLAKTGVKHNHTLLGLYEGVPLTKRGRHYSLVTPDKITIQKTDYSAKYARLQIVTSGTASAARSRRLFTN